MTDAVLFDLDGTFADTAPDLAAAVNYVRNRHHLAPLPLETLRPQASHGARGLLKLGLSIDPDHPDFVTERNHFLDYYAAHICVMTRLFEGMAELIDTLESRGTPWGIVTNKPHAYTVPLMKALGYAAGAATLVSGDTCEHAKPHPAPLLKACDDLGASPERCLYLGDDLRDMQAAKAAGMNGIIAGWGYLSEDASVENWQAAGMIASPLDLLHYLN